MTLLSKRFPSLFPAFSEEPYFNADWMPDRFWLSKMPPVNVIERENEYDIELAVPGMRKEDFHITCEDGFLTVKAEREEEKEEVEKGYKRREYNYNTFSRTFTLPEAVKTEQVKAKYENGILRLTVPIKEAAKFKKEIKIS